jgi:hypothetical protein
MLPPYVVYKAEHLWTKWTENGASCCRNNRTKSSWFDMVTFEGWFFRSLLPRLKKQTGVKVVIGNNLPSRINVAELQACQQNEIRF